MTDTMTQTSTATPQTPSMAEFVSCTGRCRWNIRLEAGFVPNVRRLFWMVRKTEPNRALPLTRSEVLSTVMCGPCAKRAGYEILTVGAALGLMEAWAYENTQRKESALNSKAAFEERAKARRLAAAIRNEHKSPINRLLATVKVEGEKPRPKHRTHRHVAGAPRTGEKRYGDERKPVVESNETKRKKKGKPGGDDNKKKGEGR